jgi:hypothetical protein
LRVTHLHGADQRCRSLLVHRELETGPGCWACYSSTPRQMLVCVVLRSRHAACFTLGTCCVLSHSVIVNSLFARSVCAANFAVVPWRVVWTGAAVAGRCRPLAAKRESRDIESGHFGRILIAQNKQRCCAALDLFLFSVDPVHWVLASHAYCCAGSCTAVLLCVGVLCCGREQFGFVQGARQHMAACLTTLAQGFMLCALGLPCAAAAIAVQSVLQ